MGTRFDPGTRRVLRGFVAAGALAAGACAAPSRSGSQPEEGFEFRSALEPQPPAVATGRLEVIEFFWYGCPHCNSMEPLLARWRARQPPDVVFRKVHAALAPRWSTHQRLFFALRQLGADEALDARVFRAIHVDGLPIDTRDAAADLVAAAGLSRPAFLSAWVSPATDAAIRDADALGQALGISGVPSLAVQGRWVTTPTMAGSYAEALAVVDVLLERERVAARNGASAATR
jgi:protein dithiol oxidoreductase (disulfide-forming)